MYRFRVSKYRNVAARVPKKEECITDLRIGELKSSSGNHIKASQRYMAFNVDAGGGGSLGILPLEDVGRKDESLPMLHTHSDFVTDMDFSPFDDRLLSTCSYDNLIKVWQIPEEGITGALSSPLFVLPLQPGRVENVLFHPAANEVLASSCAKTVTIWDLKNQEEKYCSADHQDLLQSMSWKGDGSLLATSCKDKKIRVLDLRTPSVVMEFAGVGGIKDSRVLWLGEDNKILGTGFSAMRERKMVVWDFNGGGKPLQDLSIDSSTGTLMPFFDPDTNMLFLAGKGDSIIQFLELSDSTKPCITPVSSQMMEEQHKGMAMVPKLALDVMSCEVVRLLQLTKSAVLPISYCVPRKSYREFHADLFPDTRSSEASMTSEEWFSGGNVPMKKVSLNPARQQMQPLQKPILKPPLEIEASVAPTGKSTVQSTPGPETSLNPMHGNEKPFKSTQQTDNKQDVGTNVPLTESPATSKKRFSAVRVSKFKHITGVPMHKSNNMENVRNLSISLPGDSDGFHVNREFIAYPISGPGGQIVIIPLNKPGRLSDSGLPVIECGSSVMDFAMDPFNNHQLATACESGFISIWQVPEGGLIETIDNPFVVLKGHDDKPNIVQYHPTASGVLASASFDLSVKVWDINKAQDMITLQGHREQLFSMSWKSDGSRLVTVAKDKKIRVFDPRTQVSPVQCGPGPEGSRGARVVWGGPSSDWLIVTGFSRMSDRIISLYDSRNLSEAMSCIQTNVAPSTLIPFYDEDSSIVFLSSKGETMVFAYEITETSPYIFELSHYWTKEPYQAVTFLDKTACDVKQVEIARAVKLNKTSIDQIMFQVPRVKVEYFQDDIFPDTRVWWEPALSSDQWFDGKNGMQKKLSLRPAGMKQISEAPKVVPTSKKYDSRQELEDMKTAEQKKEELLSSMVEKLRHYDDDPLPQDLQEGVDDEEWDD